MDAEMSQLWYSPCRIQNYTREEIAWVIREAWNGWPAQSSGYINVRLDVDCGSSGISPHDAQLVVWEIQARMSSAKEISLVLIFELQSDLFENADLWHYDRFKNRLSAPACSLLNYLAGKRRRRLSFAEWKRRKEKSGFTTLENSLHK